ncbi:hypothetical protein GUITHDRAFT_99995 [Guillardia theta CCMP2712]|uniref:CobW/HypB/UreG nucleotide-binding domain-containing protein n=1 Tax=Guillardia theta (strain CCMP2712) TaxID=905079 RepID=L1K2B5_GUITC|nr:hypothetical protein GUITHDRAFT_99995 [Guillardia theta CCMP2712]EKX54518.1 hypothetical protein GUITHDRAFT_99995 [Guillardia theta CCMP2712]|eukprot:XP_005841498.1 hypothetical protein GUITHDRAFT_99995 [Guillardia theta CCMP2712]
MLLEDYNDGGAYPEFHVDQYPYGIGRPMPLVPLTFICGFLGSGKTTMLKHVLENQEGKRVGVIVNDVAEVNIDAKLISKKQMSDEDETYSDTVELENGCACCTAGGDLMDSILKLIRLSIRREISYDRIVVEMSGVSEPKNLREEFLEAQDAHQVFKYVELQTMLTVVDASHFLELYISKEDIQQRPELVMKNDPSGEQHIDSTRRIVDLLVEMIECADFLILNKCDRVSSSRMENVKSALSEIVSNFNPTASVVTCSWGKVPLDVVLGAPKGKGVCKVDDEDDIRRAVKAARQAQGSRKQQT